MIAHVYPNFGFVRRQQRRGPRALSQFLGSHQTRLDGKGRTSVPAPFRNALRQGNDAGTAALVLRPSHNYPCIDGFTVEMFEQFTTPLETLDMFSEDSDDLTTALYADAWPVEADKEGRIILPDSLVKHAALTDAVVFMGLGRRFQIWEPAAAARRTAEARERTRARRITVPGRPA